MRRSARTIESVEEESRVPDVAAVASWTRGAVGSGRSRTLAIPRAPMARRWVARDGSGCLRPGLESGTATIGQTCPRNALSLPTANTWTTPTPHHSTLTTMLRISGRQHSPYHCQPLPSVCAAYAVALLPRTSLLCCLLACLPNKQSMRSLCPRCRRLPTTPPRRRLSTCPRHRCRRPTSAVPSALRPSGVAHPQPAS